MKDSKQYKDSKWVEGIRQDDENAFRKLFLKYYEPLCNFAWRYTRSKAISEDLVQNVFTKLWTLRKTLDPQKSIRVYLYQAVKNEALDYISHQKIVREAAGKPSVEIVTNLKKPIHQKQKLPDQTEFIDAARQAIDDLPKRARQVYKLHREDGLIYREIAEVMGISVKTVESQMTRALKILRNRLRQFLPLKLPVTDETLTKIFQ